MKKTSLTFLFIVSCLFAAQAQIVITEIMYNPPESGNDSLEYLELYNNSNAAVDLSGWTFSQGITHTFPSGTTLAAGNYIVLAKSASAFQVVFGFAPTVWEAGALSNAPGEDVVLNDGGGNIIDAVDYMTAAPWPVEANGNGTSLVLCDYNSDNADPANWQAASTGTGVVINGKEVYGNPNAASNCQTGNITPVDDNFSLAPGQTATISVLNNDLFVGTVTSMVITNQPSNGNATIFENKVVYVPDQGFCGADQLEYEVCNAGGCGTAVVNLTVRCYPAYSIGAVTTDDVNGLVDSLLVSCELKGTVYGVNLRPLTGMLNTTLFVIIDNSGNGIYVSSLNRDFGYAVQEKDGVTVRGIISQFNGQAEILPDTIIKTSSNNPILSPIPVGIVTESSEAKLIRINNVHLVDPAQWTNGVGNSGFNVQIVSDDNPQDTILLRIDRDVETFNSPVPPQPFNVTGLGGQFDASSPFTTGYQILPRYNADISTLVNAKEVDFSNEVLLSPNPASDILVIDMKSPFDRVTIMNAKGKVIKTLNQPALTHKVEVSLLPAGAYFVRFEKGQASWTTKFVKN